MAFLNVAVLFMSEVRVFGPINMFCYLQKEIIVVGLMWPIKGLIHVEHLK